MPARSKSKNTLGKKIRLSEPHVITRAFHVLYPSPSANKQTYEKTRHDQTQRKKKWQIR